MIENTSLAARAVRFSMAFLLAASAVSLVLAGALGAPPLAAQESRSSAQARDVSPPNRVRDAARRILENSFNPSIGIILNGRYQWFEAEESEFARFAVGHEGERGRKGLSIDESELNFSANVDDKFYGSLTAALVLEEGSQIVELEEAYVQTLPAFGLLRGLTVKAGRAFWTFGYLNEHHAHTDDFADRPLPYRVFLNRAFNDDGVQASYVLPIDFYTELGAGMYRGDDFPFGGSDGSGIEAWSVFARLGGDIGANQNWRIGGSVLSGRARSGRNTEGIVFTGDTALYGADFRYSWAPTGNRRQQELILQAEYIWRDEDGFYTGGEDPHADEMDPPPDPAAPPEEFPFDGSASGWYVQGVYKFAQPWRVGVRVSQLLRPDVPMRDEDGEKEPFASLNQPGHDPLAIALMGDWTHSEFSRLRLQYNHEVLSDGNEDNQVVLQYVMSLGAHAAHKY